MKQPLRSIAGAIGPALLAFCWFSASPAPADVGKIADLPAPRKALVKGALLEFNRPNYIRQRVAQFDLLVGASLYPEYWFADQERLGDLKDNMRDIVSKNNNCTMLGALFFPYKVWGVDPEAQADFWLRDVDGAVIPGAPGCYYVNYANPKVIEYVARRQSGLLKQFRFFEGVYLDQFAITCPAPSQYTLDLDGDGAPDSRAALDAIWRAAALELLKQLRAEWPAGLVLVNYNEPLPAEFRPLVNGTVIEIDLPGELKPEQAQKTLEALRLGAEGCAEPRTPVIVQWSEPELRAQCGELPWQELTTDRQQRLLIRTHENRERFHIGQILALMSDSFYAFEFSEEWPGQIWWFDEFSSPLGKPLRPVEEGPSGVFSREFLSGYVFLNTSDKILTRSYDSRYHDMSTHQEGSRFSIDPGKIKIIVHKIQVARAIEFKKLPRDEWSLYLPESTRPYREMPPGVQSIRVRSTQRPTHNATLNLIDGVKTAPSAWSSKFGMPQRIEIYFTKPTRINNLILWPISDDIRHLIYDYQVKVLRNGSWEKAADVQTNQETKRIQVKVDRDGCTALIFEALKTGDGRLQLREIEWN